MLCILYILKLLAFYMSLKKSKQKKTKGLNNIQSLIPKKIKLNKIKVNPLSVIEETKNKLGNFYSNLKKEREKEKQRLEKKRDLDEKRELQREKNQIQREKNCDISLFKAMGMGISDLALAVEIYKRAQKDGLYDTVPERIRTPPRLQR